VSVRRQCHPASPWRNVSCEKQADLREARIELSHIQRAPADLAIRRMKGIVMGSEDQQSPLTPDGICLNEYAPLVGRRTCSPSKGIEDVGDDVVVEGRRRLVSVDAPIGVVYRVPVHVF
jgi:hypothetical protein